MTTEGEMITPTGAALIRTLCSTFGPMPAMTIRASGTGAGTHDWPDRPNILRLFIGEASTEDSNTEVLTMLACNIDDMNPEWIEPLNDRLFNAGALDVWATPTYMKKGRPALVLEVLCHPGDAHQLRNLLFKHSTTLGIRESGVTRHALTREFIIAETPFGEVKVKVAIRQDGTKRYSPEHDDCQQLAIKHDVPIQKIYLAAQRTAPGLS